jgi:Ca-activated chloride channel homolog
MELVFNNSFYLWALIVVPLVILIHFISLKYSKARAIKFANFIALARVSEKVRINSNYFVLFLRVLVLIFVIFAIAGTSLWYIGTSVTADYVVAIDSSASMLAEDMAPTRLDVAKSTAIDFVDRLNPFYSAVSVVSFSGTPFVMQVLTQNHDFVKDAINEIEVRRVGGTDLGNAIITGSNILLGSDEPKVIILITDGRDNIGLNYKDAIFYANENNLLVYTIGIGSEQGFAEGADLLVGPLGINENQLKEISNSTGGEYFNVKTEAEMQLVYDQILDKKVKKVSLDLTFFLLIGGLALLVLEWVLVNTRFRIIP